MELDVVWRILEIVVGLAIGYFTGWARLKRFIGKVRKLVDHLDDGIADDRVTSDEWDQWWRDFKEAYGTVRE